MAHAMLSVIRAKGLLSTAGATSSPATTSIPLRRAPRRCCGRRSRRRWMGRLGCRAPAGPDLRCAFRRSVDLGVILEEVAADIVPLLVSNARAIWRVGKQLPGPMDGVAWMPVRGPPGQLQSRIYTRIHAHDRSIMGISGIHHMEY